MNKLRITYTYPTIVRQIMYLAIFFYVLLNFGVIAEIMIFKVEGYYENVRPLMTFLIYLVVFAVIIALFFGYKFCYSEYDATTLTYHNRLLRREKTLDLTQVRFAIFDRFCVKFYNTTTVDSDKDVPMFKIPFYRLGFVNAVEIDRLYRFLASRGDVGVVKTYKTLIGYSNPWKLLIVFYGIFVYAFLVNCITPVTAFLVLWQSHGIPS
ncbi:MAG: hypothetical protein ACI4WY_10645 [Anaerovoracaceae bacterium]